MAAAEDFTASCARRLANLALAYDQVGQGARTEVRGLENREPLLLFALEGAFLAPTSL